MKYYIKIALQHYAMGLVIPITIIWKLQNGLSLSAAVMTESIILLTTALADLPAGLVASKINNRNSLLVGALLHIGGVLFLALGSSFTVFVIAALLSGAAWAFISGADEAYIHDDFIEDKSQYKKVFATSSVVDEATTILGMASASLLLYLHASLRSLFVIASLILLVHFVYAAVFLPRRSRLPLFYPASTAKLHLWAIFKNKQILALMHI